MYYFEEELSHLNITVLLKELANEWTVAFLQMCLTSVNEPQQMRENGIIVAPTFYW